MKDSKHRISGKLFSGHKISILNKNFFKTYLEKIVTFFKNYSNSIFSNIKSRIFLEKINEPSKEIGLPKEVSKGDDYKKEVTRKAFHVLTILILPIAYIFLAKKIMLMVIFPLTILIVATDHFRHKIVFIDKIFRIVFGRVLRESELKQYSKTGASYMSMAALLVFTLCPKIIAICAFFILAVSDALAALVGKKLASKEFFEKSIAGSTAFGVSALIILITCGVLTNQGFGFYLFGVFAVFAVTIVEARPSFLSMDDNFTIPVLFSTIMVFFGFVWNLNY